MASTSPDCSAEALGKILQAELNSFHDNNPFPGATAAIYSPSFENGPISVAAGLADLEAGTPMRPQNRLLVGSVGKTFFAAAALQLAEQGVLDLDAPIATYLGGKTLPHSDLVTARHLLSHRSGYPEYDGSFMQSLIENPLAERSWSDWSGPVRRSQNLGEPGRDFAYSDVNYVILAAVIEGAAGESPYRLIERLFLLPLSLEDTVAADRPEIPGLIPGYESDSGLFGRDKLMPDGRLIYNPQFESGGGGYASTSGDLARWISALRNHTALSESSWSTMSTPREVSDEGHDYGLGMHIDQTSEGLAYGHSGYIPGYLSWVRWYEDRGLAVAAQVNASDSERVPGDGYDLLDAIVGAVDRGCVPPR
jgi:D-alanyl-D-alanine carboxypeptidase